MRSLSSTWKCGEYSSGKVHYNTLSPVTTAACGTPSPNPQRDNLFQLDDMGNEAGGILATLQDAPDVDLRPLIAAAVSRLVSCRESAITHWREPYWHWQRCKM